MAHPYNPDGMWLADNFAAEDYDLPSAEMGQAYVIIPDDHHQPIKHPIGFMRRKPRVRVKAWTMPILSGDR